MLNFGILLVSLVGELLCVCVIFADANEINLQLEWPISFISQGKANGVYLEIQRHAIIKKTKLLKSAISECICGSVLPCPARWDADHLVSFRDVSGRTWRRVSVNELTFPYTWPILNNYSDLVY